MPNTEPITKADLWEMKFEILEKISTFSRESETNCKERIAEAMKNCTPNKIFKDQENTDAFYAVRNTYRSRRGIGRYIITTLLGAGWVYIVVKEFVQNMFKNS